MKIRLSPLRLCLLVRPGASARSPPCPLHKTVPTGGGFRPGRVLLVGAGPSQRPRCARRSRRPLAAFIDRASSTDVGVCVPGRWRLQRPFGQVPATRLCRLLVVTAPSRCTATDLSPPVHRLTISGDAYLPSRSAVRALSQASNSSIGQPTARAPSRTGLGNRPFEIQS